MNISSVSNNGLQHSSLNNANPNFGSKKSMLASGIAKVMETDTFGKIVKGTSKSNFNIVQHLSAANGLLISGMYVKNTLKNDKLDPQKKKTLAINQASVSIVATILGYTFNNVANGWIDKFADNFRAANLKKFGADAPKKLGNYCGGIKAAASMLIFTSVYRYISPVIVTPIANKIGNVLEARSKQDTKKAA